MMVAEGTASKTLCHIPPPPAPLVVVEVIFVVTIFMQTTVIEQRPS